MEELLHQQPVFTLETADRYFGYPGERATIKRLQRLQAKGRVVRALRGVYASVPPGTEPNTFRPDPFLVLQALRPDCVFNGHSALDLHGVSNQAWNRVTAYSEAKAVTYRTQHATFTLIKSPRWLTPDALSKVDRKGVFLRVTRPELALVEGFRYPGRVGGIEELVKSAGGFRRLDLSLLMDLLDRFQMRKLYAAVGWFLSREPGRWHVTDDFLEQLRVRRPVSPSYLERWSSGSVMDSEWNLMIPRELSRQQESNVDI
ncbi:MAG TPA: type IV toxin-antitoxin system AbiEi family antitoxin domain-containing protein [Fimbriimonas sp.]